MSEIARYKGILFDYDFIKAKGYTETQGICLTYRERQILLTMMDFVGWKTRWFSKTDQTITQDEIDNWRDKILGKLMFEDCSMTCAEVIQCILDDLDDDGEFPQGLKDWLETHGGGITAGGDATGTGTIPETYDDLMSGMTCNMNNVFGFTLQFVQLMNRMIEDFFEIVEQLEGFIEYSGAIVESIPILTSVLDFVDFLCENIADNYLAHYDTAYENELACELACIAYTEDCELSFETLLDVMSTRVQVDWTEISLNDLCGIFITGTWSGTEYCNLAIYACAYILANGAGWGGYSLQMIQRLLEAFWNDPNSDWSTICECGWIKTYVFDEEDLGNWVCNQGIWANTYAYYSQISGVNNEADVDHDYVGFDGLTSIKVLRRWDLVVETGQGLRVGVTHSGGTDTTVVAFGSGAVRWIEETFDPPLDGVTNIHLEARHNSIEEGGSVAIEKIRLEGVGSDAPIS